MDRNFDAVIVGSGFGEGLIACRLAGTGLKVCGLVGISVDRPLNKSAVFASPFSERVGMSVPRSAAR